MSVPAAEPRAARHLTVMAFDVGTRRTGVATGNTVTASATPLGSVRGEGDARWAAIDPLIAEWRPDALVVGIPLHPDGRPHANTTRARRFAQELGARTSLPVHRVDERYTTVEAVARGEHDRDAGAAAVILEQWLGEQARGVAA